VCLCPALRPRQDRRARPYSVVGAAPALSTAKAPATNILSRLNHTALALAVYASYAVLPRPTQDSLPAVGQLCGAGLVTRRIPTKGFQVASYISSPFPKLCLAQGQSPEMQGDSPLLESVSYLIRKPGPGPRFVR
jgi:hypothetical protein